MSKPHPNWIAKMHMKKGALHKQMGVPADKKIPGKKLEKAASKAVNLASVLD